MIIYMFKDMIKTLLRRKSNLLIFLLIIVSCKKQINNRINKELEIRNDTTFFKTDDIFGEKWVVSNRDSADIFRVFNKINDTLFEVENYIKESNKLLSKGKLKNIRGRNPLESVYSGFWYYYGDGDIGLYQIGGYKNGKKSGVWCKSYEDGVAEIFYFKDDTSIEYNDSISISNDRNELLAYGKGVKSNGVPKGKWFFNFKESGIKSERIFTDSDSAIIVKYKDFEITTNKLISEGSFSEEK